MTLPLEVMNSIFEAVADNRCEAYHRMKSNERYWMFAYNGKPYITKMFYKSLTDTSNNTIFVATDDTSFMDVMTLASALTKQLIKEGYYFYPSNTQTNGITIYNIKD